MAEPLLNLEPVDKVEILTLMDNYTDVLLPGSDIVQRPPLAVGGQIPTTTVVAEHGLSLLVTVHKGDLSHTVLLDTGWTAMGVIHNMNVLGIDPEKIETIVLSHGHMDHTGTLVPILERISHPVDVVLHPHALLSPRYLQIQDGAKLLFPKTLADNALRSKGAELVWSEKPTPVADSMVGVTGQVERVTGFEKGLPNAMMEKDGKVVPDPILDDQAMVIHLKDKGLVVVAGCSHAGIINTLLYARKITGIQRIYAVFGGFHLSGTVFEPIIEDTLRELKQMDPAVLVPMHCTGWKALHRFEEEFPQSFVLNSVGTKFTLTS